MVPVDEQRQLEPAGEVALERVPLVARHQRDLEIDLRVLLPAAAIDRGDLVVLVDDVVDRVQHELQRQALLAQERLDRPDDERAVREARHRARRLVVEQRDGRLLELDLDGAGPVLFEEREAVHHELEQVVRLCLAEDLRRDGAAVGADIGLESIAMRLLDGLVSQREHLLHNLGLHRGGR